MSVIKAQNENAVSLLANEAVINKHFSLAAQFLHPCKLFVIKYRRTYNQRYVSSIESYMSFQHEYFSGYSVMIDWNYGYRE